MIYKCDYCKNQITDNFTLEIYCNKGNWRGTGPLSESDLEDDYSDEWDDCEQFESDYQDVKKFNF